MSLWQTGFCDEILHTLTSHKSGMARFKLENEFITNCLFVKDRERD